MFDRSAIVRWHLEGNIYPPVNDPEMVEFALSAIDLHTEGKADNPVFIHVDGRVKRLIDQVSGEEVTANQVIDNWKLEVFLIKPDEEEQ
jgi:hypothetical protein